MSLDEDSASLFLFSLLSLCLLLLLQMGKICRASAGYVFTASCS